MVSQTDVSRVEAGQAPFSPDEPRRPQRTNMLSANPATPTRPPGGRRPSVSSLSYDDETSYTPAHGGSSGFGPTLRDSIAAMGAIAGFREWRRRRAERSERQRAERIRQQEIDNEEQFNKRNSDHYPRPQDASGRRQSMSGTIMTGPDPVLGSNPNLSRHNLRPDISQPPLPAAAGSIPTASNAPPSVGRPPNVMEQHQHQQQVFNLPPPPPGPPPPDAARLPYQAPAPGSLQMPQGAVNPDPSRLMGEHNVAHQSQTHFHHGSGTQAAVGAASALATSQRTQSMSPSRRGGRRDSRSRLPARRGSTSASMSQVDNVGVAGDAASPPISVKMKVHPDGRHVTLRRLNEEEAAAERTARRRERRSRRASSLSSADEGSSRYRRNNGMRDSSQQPIINVPPPPAMSSSLGGSHRPPSELNLPPARPAMPQASDSPQAGPSGLPPAAGPAGSGAVGSPGNVAGGTDLGTGTDLSTFDNNRRRRRAERARRLEASKGNKVEFS